MKVTVGEADVGGTHLQGYLNTTYERLVQVFGPPSSDGDGYKVDAEWELEFEGGVVATIYNYKDGFNYNGEDGDAVANITDWHVGGKSKDAFDLVCQLVEGQLTIEGPLLAITQD